MSSSLHTVGFHVSKALDLLHTLGFEELDLRSSGQVATQVRSYIDLLKLTLAAWETMDRAVFQAAWVSCGYFDYNHMKKFDKTIKATELDLSHARATLDDAFSICGKGPFSPQRCTRFEWQWQDGLC